MNSSQVAELVRRTIRGFSAYRSGIQNEKRTGSNPGTRANSLLVLCGKTR